MPTISVIVPVYKVAPCLRRCVDSILNQSFTDFELILVDDGSPDNCPVICDEYVAQDNRVKVIHKPNGGLSSARNAGLDIATGEYVLFVDSDDYIVPDLLATVLKPFETDVDRVTFNFFNVDEKSGQIRDALPQRNVDYNLRTEMAKQVFFVNDLVTYHVSWAAWASAYKRSIIEQYHIRFVDTKIVFAEDLLFSLCYSACCSSVSYVGEPLYYYVTNRSGSIMEKENHKINANRLNELCKYFFQFIQSFTITECLLDVFPNVYFTTIDSHLLKYEELLMLSEKEIRNKAIDDLKDKSFFRDTMVSFSRQHYNSKDKKWYWQWYDRKKAVYWARGNTINLWLVKLFEACVQFKRRKR